MSTADAELEVAGSPVLVNGALTSAREARVGDMTVRRLLPLRQRRSVGAWCFADHYGPMSVDGVAGMRVPPHPHIGLQTVTCQISGNVLHRDSLGSENIGVLATACTCAEYYWLPSLAGRSTGTPASARRSSRSA